MKGPIQWLVGSCRALERPLPPPVLSYQILRMLGQVPFAPPSVKGWDTGVSWISTNTLLDRYNFSALLVQGQPIGLGGPNKAFAKKEKEENPKVATAMDAAPAGGPAPLPGIDVEKLFTPQELADADSALDAIEKRLIEGPLGESRRNSLRQYLQDGKPGPERVKGAIRLLMSTPDYQLS